MAHPRYLYKGRICWRGCSWRPDDPNQPVELTDMDRSEVDEDGVETQWWWARILDRNDELFGREVLVRSQNIDCTMPDMLVIAYAALELPPLEYIT